MGGARLVRRLGAALALAAGRAAGQAAATPARPLPVACVAPADSARWERRTLSITLSHADSGGTYLPVPVRQLALEDISARLWGPLISAEERARAVATGAGVPLPSADARYGPRVLLTKLRFTMFGDGTVGSLVHDTTAGETQPFGFTRVAGDSLFEADLRRAIERASAEMGLPPFSTRGKADSAMLMVRVTDLPLLPGDTTTAAWPLFKLELPASRHAAPSPKKGPKIRYPDYLRSRGFEGTVVMRFVVDEMGHPVRSTIGDVRGKNDIPPRFEPAYREFVAAVTRGIRGAEYQPAEMLGCRVRELVNQPFNFGLVR